MSSSSYRRHRFPAAVIQQAVWLYFRFPLSLRDVEDMLSQRGIDVSHETVRRWSFKFGLAYAENSDARTRVLMRVGISMKSSSRSTARTYTCGAPLIARERSWTCWCNRAETSEQP